MGFLRKHLTLSAIIALIFITIPSAIEAWWSLWEKLKGVDMPSLNLGIMSWIFPLIGIALFIITMRQIGKVKPVIKFENETPDRLEEVLDNDKANIRSRIYVRDYMWDFQKLTEPDPYIDLVFTIINAAVFAINIMGGTGRFLIEGHECAQAAEFTGSKRLPHGEIQSIRIRQRLTKEMASLIINRRDLIPTSKIEAAKKGKINISLKACQLSIVPEIESELAKTVPLTIGGDYEVNIP